MPEVQASYGIDIQDEVKCGLVTLHVQEDMSRHHLIMHVSRLDTFCKIREEMRGVAGASETPQAVKGLMLVQIGAAKGEGCKKGKKSTDVQDKGKGELLQAEKERDDAKKLAEKKKDKH